MELVEREMDEWESELERVVVIRPAGDTYGSERRVVDETMVESGRADGSLVPAIVEVSRGRMGLAWEIAQSFERFVRFLGRIPFSPCQLTSLFLFRFVVHCLARQRNLVSFSVTHVSGARITHIVRQQSHLLGSSSLSTNPLGLDTPPATDMSSVGGSDSELSAAAARWELESLGDETTDGEKEGAPTTALEDVEEFLTPSPIPEGEDEGSTGRDSEATSSDDESDMDESLASSIASLVEDHQTSLLPHAPVPPVSSSPSPSPALEGGASSTPKAKRTGTARSSLGQSGEAGDEVEEEDGEGEEMATPKRR